MKYKCVILLYLLVFLQTGNSTTLSAIEAYLNLSYGNLSQTAYNQAGVNQTLLTNALMDLMGSAEYGTYFQDASINNILETIFTAEVAIQTCPQGTYGGGESTTCTSCGAGTYSLTANASSAAVCIQCPSGTYSSALQATSASACQNCPADTYSSVIGLTSSSGCIGCGVNSIAPNGSSSKSQCSCKPGYVSNGTNGTCLLCPTGSFCYGGTSNKCPQFSTSSPNATTEADCLCLPGYNGKLPDYHCTLCLGDHYCEGGKETPTPCPSGSSSLPGSTSLTDCRCREGYQTTSYASQTRSFEIQMSKCNCSVGTPADNCGNCTSDCVQGQVCGLPCDRQIASSCDTYSPTMLTCPQGYVQLYNDLGYSNMKKQIWWIIPNNGFEIINLTFSVLDVDATELLQIASCTSEKESDCTNLNAVTLTTFNSLSQRWFLSKTGFMRINWVTSSDRVGKGWKASYTTSTERSCSFPTVAMNGGSDVLTSPLFVWEKDTLEFVSKSGYPLSLSRSSTVADSAATVSALVTNPSGIYYIMDPKLPSRQVKVVSLPATPKTWQIYTSIVSGQFLLSGDVTGLGSPIYMSIGDTLVLHQNLSQTIKLLSSSEVLLPTTNVLRGQNTYHISWDTSGAQAGIYFFRTSTDSVSGKIYLSGRAGGVSCELCKEGTFCYMGQTFQCPAYSKSPLGATDAAQCVCDSGYYTEQTNIIAYSRSQTMDNSGKHGCAIIGDNKELFCWGLSTSGQTGRTDSVVLSMPAHVWSVVNVSQVSVGADFTCVILASTSKVKCFGGNGYGQLGQESTASSSKSTDVESIPVTNLGANYKALSISCNGYTCCAVIMTTGYGLKCWGDNSRGQLGLGTSGGSVGRSPNTMGDYLNAVTGFGTDTVLNVSVGGTHVCALGLSGKLYCWGDNTYGQLAFGVSDPFRSVPVESDVYGLVEHVNCNAGVCCVIMQNKRGVKCWGQGKDPITGLPNGRLGTDTRDHVGLSQETIGINIPFVQIGQGRLAVDVNVGDVQTCVLLDNNHVKCWGLVQGAVIGDQPLTEMYEFLPNVLFENQGMAVQIGGKGLDQCAVLSSYKLSCWGDNQYNQLGIPESESPGLRPYANVGGFINMSNMTVIPFPNGALVVKSSGTAFTKTCSSCPANYYCDGSNNGDSIQACPTSMNSPAYSISLSSCGCDSGYYKDATGVCQICPAGSYCLGNVKYACPMNATTVPGSIAASDCKCQKGYSAGQNGGCLPCASGYYKDTDGNAECTPCPVGTSSNRVGMQNLSACISCPAGTYGQTVAAVVCSICQPGTYSNSGSIQCISCEHGQYSTDNRTSCLPCQPGTYQEAGFSGGIESCSLCVSGKYSTIAGAVHEATCNRCADGHFSVQGSSTCTACPANTFSFSGDLYCQPCPANSSTNGTVGASASMCQCKQGYFQDAAGVVGGAGFKCSACGRGTYSEQNGTSCSLCPSGTYQDKTLAISCSLCQAGQYSQGTGNSACTGCSIGYFVGSPGATACSACPEGSYAAGNSSSCTPCGPGFFGQGIIGTKSQCQSCPKGYFCGGDGLMKPCPMGTFSGQLNLVTVGQCLTCPANYYCPLPYLKNQCPPGTTSVAGTSNMLGCKCMAGVVCSYKKLVQAVINLNVTSAYFIFKDAQQQFVKAVAKSASVPVENVFLSKIIEKSTGEEICVSLYKDCPLRRRRNLLGYEKRGVHVLVSIVGAERLLELGSYMHSVEAYGWYARHHVDVQK